MSSGGSTPECSPLQGKFSPLAEDDGTYRVTPIKRRRILPLVDLRGSGGMTSSSIELGGPSAHHIPVGLSASASVGHGRRCRTPLTDLDSKFVTKSGLCGGSVDIGEGGSLRGIKITHLTGPSSGAASSGEDSAPRFPRLDQCAHFHYEYVELPPIEVSLVSEDLKPLSQYVSSEDNENRSLLVQVSSLGRSWVVRRTYDNFRFLDRQLHRCCYDRKYSQLSELPPEENVPGENKETAIETSLRAYLSRLSDVAGSLITCGPVLSWLELDNRGHRLIVTDDSDINTPAVAAAYVVKRYSAQASDEISFEVGDMISVIDMPPPEESIWWRGKRGFQVGFFPCECVQVIGDKVPQSIHTQALTLPPKRICSAGNSPFLTQASSSTTEPLKPVLRKHGKLIAFFRSFILSRPSRRKLKQSGILRERVFGCDLGEHLLNSGHEIPMVLKCCAEFIESHGTVDGIYRLSGITSNIQKLRNAFDEERIPDLYGDESITQDIHCVSSVLKMYFRELPNPLLTYQLYDKFVNAVMQSEEVRLLHIRDVVQQLPPPHYRTLEYLIQHLARIASHSSSTSMTPRNIAIVWAPNLLRSKDLEKGGVAALQDVGTQAVVTEFLVHYVDLIFNDKIPLFSPSTNGMDGTPRKSRPKSLAISTPTKLLSIDEARSRALAAIKSDQKYIEVGGGPQSLPKTYHTVIDLPSRKGGSLKQKKSPLGWKTLFSKNRHQRKASTPNEVSLNASDSAVTEEDLSSHTTRRLRPVKSVESLVSTPVSLHSIRNAEGSDSLPKPSIFIRSPSHPCSKDSSSDTSSIPSPRTHNRSVSHDSYFNHLERSTSSVSGTGVVKEERESDLEFSPGSSKMFLDISELNIDFSTSEAEMKIFSEDETLKSTSVEDTLSRSTIDLENVSMTSDCSKSKENVSREAKRSKKGKLKAKFSSPSALRKDYGAPLESGEDSKSNSLHRASSSAKGKIVDPEMTEKKTEISQNSESSMIDKSLPPPRTSSPKDEFTETESRGSIESALIDPELLDKITRMRISSSVSASDASSYSLAEATVSDNESFTLGSSSNGAGSGGTLPLSSCPTPCTPPLTIVADAQFQEEVAQRGQDTHHKERPSSLLMIPQTGGSTLGAIVASPDTPQGDSTFLEIYYHPLSDTTEPSTPSESHVEVLPPQLDKVPITPSPLSPDLSSSSSANDHDEGSPVYENMELSCGSLLTKENIDKNSTASNSKPSPDTISNEVTEVEYENVEYNQLSHSPCLDTEARTSTESLLAVSTNENNELAIDQTYENVSLESLSTSEAVYENVEHQSSSDQAQALYEVVSFSEADQPEYENMEFKTSPLTVDQEGEIVYQQVKYLRRSIQEVNEIVNNIPESNEDCEMLLPTDSSAEENECLESPVTPSSSSLVTEVLVLPAFSSPTESTTEEATSPDDSRSFPHSSHLSSPIEESSTVVASPNNEPLLLPCLSPPSPDSSSSVVPPVATSTPTRNVNLALVPSPFPRSSSKHSQIWPPVPKPRSLPSLNINSPTSSNSTDGSITPDSPATSGTLSYADSDNCEDQEELLANNSSQENETEIKALPMPSASELPCADENVESESQKRERINKYKEERRSYLREKFKSESFRGEKDEMLLRLKQKATSPSRQDDNDDDDPVSPGSARASVDVSSTSFQSSVSRVSPTENLAMINKEIIFHRSLSDGSKVSSTFQKSLEEEDVNVRERVAHWSRQKIVSEEQEKPTTDPSSSSKHPVVVPVKESDSVPKLRKLQVSSIRLSDCAQHKPPVLASKPLEVQKSSSCTESRIPSGRPNPHSPLRKTSAVFTQKCDPPPLKTRSYSVGTSLGSSTHPKRIKDMKALFEKEPTSDFTRPPFPLRQISKEGV